MFKVEFAEAEAMCEFIPEILFVMETSAKENTNIEDAFVCLATELKVSNLVILNIHNIKYCCYFRDVTIALMLMLKMQ